MLQPLPYPTWLHVVHSPLKAGGCVLTLRMTAAAAMKHDTNWYGVFCLTPFSTTPTNNNNKRIATHETRVCLGIQLIHSQAAHAEFAQEFKR